jgi:pescadillo protein
LVLSFGGQFVTGEQDDSKVTHFVMDRPVSDAFLNANQNKEFVQPQYIIDCVNNLYLLPTSQYRPGTPPPAHLSPFIDNEQEGYVPMRHKEIQHLKGEEVVETESEDEEMVEAPKAPKKVTEKKKVEKKPAAKRGKGDADSSSEEGEASDDDAPVAQTA